MSKLLELAERCEKAEGPDRGVDGDIVAALTLQPDWATVRSTRQPELFSDTGPGLRARTWLAPKFTASLDAAMTLVCADHWRVEDHPLAGPCAIVGEQEGYAATPALALCAAALRAKASQEDQSKAVGA